LQSAFLAGAADFGRSRKNKYPSPEGPGPALAHPVGVVSAV